MRLFFSITVTCILLNFCLSAQYNRVYQDLLHPDATGILHDDSGVMWISTFGGLCNYNGLDVVNYINPNFNLNRSLSNRILNFESKNSPLIWMITDDGIHCFDKLKLSYLNIKFRDHKNYRSLPIAVHFIHKSKLLVLLYADQMRLYDFEYNAALLNIRQTINTEGGVFVSEQSDDGDLWIANNNSIYKLGHNTKQSFVLEKQNLDFGNISNKTIESFDLITKDSLAILFADRVLFFKENLLQHQINLDIPTLDIQNVHDFDIAQHQIHIASMDNYICLDVDENYNVRLNKDANSIKGSNVNNICLVENEIAWLSCYGNGVYYQSTNQIQQVSNSKKFTNPKEIYNKYIRGIAVDKDENLWIGTNEDGLYKVNLATSDIKSFEHFSNETNTNNSSKVRSILIDKQDRIFIGTQAGLSFSSDNGQTFQRLNLKGDNKENQFFFSLVEDNYGYLWVGSFGNGLTRLKLVGDKIISTEYFTIATSPSITSDEISYLYSNPERNEIWASSKQGVNKIALDISGNVSQIEHIILSDILPNQGFSDFTWPIEIINKDTVWIGTIGSGIVKLWEEDGLYKTKVYDVKTGLSSNDIEVMHYDYNDHLWIGNNGLTKLNIRTGEQVVFNKHDGLRNDFFRVGSSYRSLDSTLYFGGTNGLDVFKSNDFLIKNSDAKIRLDELSVNYNLVKPNDNSGILNQTINSTSEIKLKHYENNLAITFSSLNFQNQKSDSYEYKLYNYDSDFKVTNANNRVASYSKLDAGEYIFKIRSINRNGNKSPLKELKINITPAIWLSNFAKFVYLAFASLLIYWLYRNFKSRSDLKKAYTKELERSNQDLEKQVSIKTSSLRHIISELDRSNQDLEKFAHTATHDLKEPLRTIGAYVQLIDKKYGQEIDDKGKKYMHFITDGVSRMTSLVNKLLEFSKIGNAELKLESVDLNKLVSEQVANMQLYIDERGANVEIDNLGFVNCDEELMGIVFFNLIHNGIKYNEHSQPNVRISRNKFAGSQLIKISDNGIGIPDEDKDKVFDSFYRSHGASHYSGSGIGLSTVIRIVEKHGGKISIESNAEKGTTMVISLQS